MLAQCCQGLGLCQHKKTGLLFSAGACLRTPFSSLFNGPLTWHHDMFSSTAQWEIWWESFQGLGRCRAMSNGLPLYWHASRRPSSHCITPYSVLNGACKSAHVQGGAVAWQDAALPFWRAYAALLMISHDGVGSGGEIAWCLTPRLDQEHLMSPAGGKRPSEGL